MTDHIALIIVRDTLRALGMKHLLSSLFGMDASIAQDATPIASSNECDRFDMIFVDEYNCLSHLDLFIPRKSKTIILANTDADKYISWQHINCNADIDHIVESVAAISANRAKPDWDSGCTAAVPRTGRDWVETGIATAFQAESSE